MPSLPKLTKNLVAGLFPKKKEIAIVYYAYINPQKDWQSFVLGQLTDLKKTDILTIADLYIVVSNPFGLAEVKGFFDSLSTLYRHIEYYQENKFEYWGIACVWRLVQEQKQYQYFVYFHTKGMTHEQDGRIKVEQLLMQHTFKHWQQTIQVFEENKLINKVGLFPAWKVNAHCEIVRGGWIWYNFWWARSTYLSLLEPPKINPKHRFYYEEWLTYLQHDSSSKFYDSFSTHSMSMTSYTNQQALELTDNLIASIGSLLP